MTLEEMQAEIIRLQEIENNLTAQNETLQTTVQESLTRITELQEHNQKLFLKVSTDTGNKTEEEKPVQSCVDFAKELIK